MPTFKGLHLQLMEEIEAGVQSACRMRTAGNLDGQAHSRIVKNLADALAALADAQGTQVRKENVHG